MREVRFELGYKGGVSLLLIVYVETMGRSFQNQRQIVKAFEKAPAPGRESKVLPPDKSLNQGAQCRLHREAWAGELGGNPVMLPGSGTKGSPRIQSRDPLAK